MSLAMAADADVKVIQQMLGNADAATTLDVYGHPFSDRLDEVADVFNARRTQALARIAAWGSARACGQNVGSAGLSRIRRCLGYKKPRLFA
jgi:hypothetical protein